MRIQRLASLTALFAVGCAGCSGASPSDSDVSLDVYAAASLNDAFSEIATLFHEANPDVRLVLNFAGSATLAQQVREGAPADIVALADAEKMNQLGETKTVDVSSITPFARNSLALVVEQGNPKEISTLSDLAAGDIVTVLCDIAQPCGTNAEVVLKKMKVVLSPASRESNVNGVIQKVSSGEADAGIVYVTDALAHSDTLDTIAIPAEANVTNSYPIAIASDISTTEQQAAQKFISFVTNEGSEVLARLGFAQP